MARENVACCLKFGSEVLRSIKNSPRVEIYSETTTGERKHIRIGKQNQFLFFSLHCFKNGNPRTRRLRLIDQTLIDRILGFLLHKLNLQTFLTTLNQFGRLFHRLRLLEAELVMHEKESF